MANVAIIETKPSRTNYEQRFEGAFEFDQYALCSDASKKKVLKADVDIEIDIDSYEWVVLIGSEALKFFTKLTKITELRTSLPFIAIDTSEISSLYLLLINSFSLISSISLLVI